MEALLTHTRLLAALAICLRGMGVSIRLSPSPATRLAGWVLTAVATWAAAGAAGAFAPLWPALLIGLAGGLGELRLTGGREEMRLPDRRAGTDRPGGKADDRSKPGPPWLVAVGDGAVVLVALGLSIPRLEWGVAAALVVALAVGWGLMEVIARLAGSALRVSAGVAAAVAMAVLLLSANVTGRGFHWLPLPSMVLHVAVTTQCEGERVELGEGAVAWFQEPAGDGADRGALLLHGHDHAGSRQPAACILRRALVHAGFATLAVDHPGFGASRTPSVDAPLEAWDPTVPQAEALDWLTRRPGIHQVAVVGHSMGVADAMRLIRLRPEIPLAFLFGGSVDPPEEDDEFWYDRFHWERGLGDRLGPERWREIRETYYHKVGAAGDLPPGHGRIVWAVFEHEWEYILEHEETVYRMIPGTKERWNVARTSHYMNTLMLSGVLVADYRAARETAAGLRARTDPAQAE